MADAVTIQVESRDPAKNKGTGSRVARKLRKEGRIPAIVYGHKQAPTPISLARDDVWQMIKNATHLAQLKIGDVTEMVLVRDLQWDHLGKEILHLDFFRVSADESIQTHVPLELHGTAPGLAAGGILEHLVHSLTVNCRATAIPESIRLGVGNLQVDEGIHLRDLVLPEGVTAEGDPDMLLVHVIARPTEAEPTVIEGGTAEPEVIGRKAEDKDAKE